MKRFVSILMFLAPICDGWSASHQVAHVFDATISHPAHSPTFCFCPPVMRLHPDTHWPLILYLHGGLVNDVEQLRTLGLPHKLESEPDFPFVVVSRSVLLAKSGRMQKRSTGCWIA